MVNLFQDKTTAPKNIILLILLIGLIGCNSKCDSNRISETRDWRQEYLNQEKKRIVTVTKHFDFISGSYSMTDIDSVFETFNEKGQKLGIDNRHFYKYDTSGKLISEEYCMRTCEHPGKEIYYYDSLNRLIKTVVIASKETQWVSAQYYYNDKNLLTKKVMGNGSTPITETYTYDSLSRQTTATRREYNTNLNKWLTFTDSMFYKSDNKMILKKRCHIGKDLITISKYRYHGKLLISQVDTTITTLKEYLPTPETTHHAYYFRIDYKYNFNNKLIEKVITRPDYKTPSFKITYEYR